MLSICFAVHRRSRFPLGNGEIVELFPNCLRSLAKAVSNRQDIEVVICDFDSSDWPLEDWVGSVLGGIPYRIIPATSEFHRGSGRNFAAEHAFGENLLFMDADMLVTEAVINHGQHCLSQSKLYYPTCFYFLNAEHTLGFWADGARGIVFMPRSIFDRVGQWPCPPEYPSHYNEDQVFFRNVKRHGLEFERRREDGFFHQYHPGRSVDTILRRRKKLIRTCSDGVIH